MEDGFVNSLDELRGPDGKIDLRDTNVVESWLGTRYYQAGDLASTQDVGGTLPPNFIPSAACDPQDASAVTAFYNAGVQLLGLVRAQWTGIGVSAPQTYWRATSIPGSCTSYQLTGLGAGLPAICM